MISILRGFEVTPFVFVRANRIVSNGRGGHFYLLWVLHNFNPDQISSTAQTFMSTSPLLNAKSLITSSVISVAIFDDFFGQEIHIIPFGSISFLKESISLFKSSPFW